MGTTRLGTVAARVVVRGTHWSKRLNGPRMPAPGFRGLFPRPPSRWRGLQDVESIAHRRMALDLPEFDRVLGGGIVPGSLVLLGGDPGIGKSTLLLQVSNLVAQRHGPVLYATGEESAEQVKLRADRLAAIAPELYIMAETDVDAIASQAGRTPSFPHRG